MFSTTLKSKLKQVNKKVLYVAIAVLVTTNLLTLTAVALLSMGQATNPVYVSLQSQLTNEDKQNVGSESSESSKPEENSEFSKSSSSKTAFTSSQSQAQSSSVNLDSKSKFTRQEGTITYTNADYPDVRFEFDDSWAYEDVIEEEQVSITSEGSYAPEYTLYLTKSSANLEISLWPAIGIGWAQNDCYTTSEVIDELDGDIVRIAASNYNTDHQGYEVYRYSLHGKGIYWPGSSEFTNSVESYESLCDKGHERERFCLDEEPKVCVSPRATLNFTEGDFSLPKSVTEMNPGHKTGTIGIKLTVSGSGSENIIQEVDEIVENLEY